MIYFNKSQITKVIIAERPIPIKLDIALGKWWTSGRAGESLRLSPAGAEAFFDAGIEYKEFQLFTKKPENTHAVEKFIFDIAKKLRCPYYLDYVGSNRGIDCMKVKIRIYDDRIAMMIVLYGTFQDYLDSLRR